MIYMQDLRYALRLLIKQPFFTALTILVLAGGLGVSIFTFSFLYTAIMRPLPLEGGDRIVRLLVDYGGAAGAVIDAADLAAIRPRISSLVELGAYDGREVIVGEGAATRTIQATASEANLFTLARTGAAIGRTLTRADQAEGAEPVIVLSHWAWTTVFGGDSSLVNDRIPVNGVMTRVAGVMPEGFGFPVAAEAWVPLPERLLRVTAPRQDWLQAYARLAPGANERQAGAELSTLLRAVRGARVIPDSLKPNEPTGMVVRSFPVAQIGEQAPLVLIVLNTLAGLILLLACINVTNLLLARANERARETAVRLALGAPRGRLIMQSMWESIILCVTGGVLATIIAGWGLSMVTSWSRANLEGNMAFWWVWRLDGAALLSSAAFIVLAIGGLGTAMAVRATRTEINAVLQDAARGSGRREGRTARALVATQVAAVSVLLFFGTLSAIVAYRVANVDPGFDTRNLLSSGINLPSERYGSPALRGGFYQQMLDRLSARVEVDGVLLRREIGEIGDGSGEVLTAGQREAGSGQRAYVQAALGPLSTLGVDLVEGRFFDAGDHPAGAPSVILSASLARRLWPTGSAVGRQLQLPGVDDSWRTVVGVVDDVLLGNPFSRDRSPLAAWVPMLQTQVASARIEFRHRGNVGAAQAAFHQTLSAIDPLVAPGHVQSFDEILAKSSLMARSVAALFAACFGFALLLAISGTYGLMARSISRRTRELGVRRALGATEALVVRMLLGEGARQFAVGAAVALPFTLLIAWGFSRSFPIPLAVTASAALAVAGLVTAVVLLASLIPARRAVKLEPRDALFAD